MRKVSELLNAELSFFPELGIGHYPVPKDARPYDAEYFARYRERAATPMGDALTKARVDLVKKYWSGPVCDVGIGAGQFVDNCEGAVGFDVNPVGIAWLADQNKFHDFYQSPIGALTFWDALEHIDEPDVALAQATDWVFVSIPIFTDAEHITRSIHYRKDEHIWYFTHAGLIRFMGGEGFDLVEYNTIETDLGRDGIGTYAFKRKK